MARLHREPERALLIEDRCVRAAGMRVCHRGWIFGNVPGLGVEFPDVGVNPTLVSLGAIRRKNRQMKELSDDLFHT